MIFDIFSTRKKKNKIQEKHKIIIDVHEKNSLVMASLSELGIEFEIKSLEIGDYIVNDVVVERKTISDFISSMISKRLIKQLLEMQRYDKKILLIEGEIDEKGFNPNAIRGMILSIELDMKISVIFTKDAGETAKFLSVLVKKQEKVKGFSFHGRKGLTKKEKIQYIVESFAEIGPKTAEKLLKEFETIRNIINTDIEKLREIIGVKADSFKILDEKY
jgi:Fanconi anemia group M protein